MHGLEVIRVGRWQFLIESQTRPGEHHCVDLEDEVCTCLGYLVHGHCWHLLLKEEGNDGISEASLL